MSKKYEFTGETRELPSGLILQQIRRLSDGVVGGWIEKEGNLSHEGDCWVGDNAQVFGYARVSGNAQVFGNAQVHGNAMVYGDARVSGCAQAQTPGDNKVCEDTSITIHNLEPRFLGVIEEL